MMNQAVRPSMEKGTQFWSCKYLLLPEATSGKLVEGTPPAAMNSPMSFIATCGGTAETRTVKLNCPLVVGPPATSPALLSVSPASGSSSSTLTAAVNTAGLAAGTYNGTITVSATGSSPKTVGVTLTVSAPLTSSATLTWNPNTDADLAGYNIYRATASGA